MISGRHAWVDESQSDWKLDPGTYVLAATITSPGAEQDVRLAMRALQIGDKKLHWREESRKRRLQIFEAVVRLELRHVVVVRAGARAESAARRRSKCLESLVAELDARGVEMVTAESRGKADDKRDLEVLNGLRGGRRVSRDFRLDHVVGVKEPMLWVPDALCGAVTSARTGDRRFLAMLGNELTFIEDQA